ncbi:hypothetical protein HY627_01960 [Candidatus Uhrbacteria bacterium]|nr:hypothetical protein [Candidatus Uhrbacteria bacterium]
MKKIEQGDGGEFISEAPLPSADQSKADIAKVVAERREKKKEYARRLYEFLYVMKEEPVYFPWRRKLEIETMGEKNADYVRYKKSKLRDLALTDLCNVIEDIAFDGYITIPRSPKEKKEQNVQAIENLKESAQSLREEIRRNKEVLSLRKLAADELDDYKRDHLQLVGKTGAEVEEYCFKLKQEVIAQFFPEIAFGRKIIEKVPLHNIVESFDWLKEDEHTLDEEGKIIRIQQYCSAVAARYPREFLEIEREQDAFLKPIFDGLAAKDKYGHSLDYVDNHRYIAVAEELACVALRAMYPELAFLEDIELQDALEWKLFSHSRKK